MICLGETLYKTSKTTTCVWVSVLLTNHLMFKMSLLDHVLVTDEAASGVAPITVDKNGTHPDMYIITRR